MLKVNDSLVAVTVRVSALPTVTTRFPEVPELIFVVSVGVNAAVNVCVATELGTHLQVEVPAVVDFASQPVIEVPPSLKLKVPSEEDFADITTAVPYFAVVAFNGSESVKSGVSLLTIIVTTVEVSRPNESVIVSVS